MGLSNHTQTPAAPSPARTAWALAGTGIPMVFRRVDGLALFLTILGAGAGFCC